MSEFKINIWNTIQSVVTVIFIAFYPFIICLFFQIKHEMASNPSRFQMRKILLLTCLIMQLVIFTFLRDQYIWNEQINEEDEVPNALLCGLYRFLYYGIIEMSTYYLIIILIWDETEAINISKHQLNPKIVENIKTKFEDKAFHISTIFKIYTFCTSCITLLPSSIMPNSIQNQFLNGIEYYRCQISNVTNCISILNKIIFLLLLIYSSIQLRQIEIRHYSSNTISLFIIIPICIILYLFVICNENWLNILSLDNSRKIGFICSILFTISMTCNHIMMQAQAKKKIIQGARRVSTILVHAGQSVRHSIIRKSSKLLKPFNVSNKIAIESTLNEASQESSSVSMKKNRFSIPEITEDEYDAVMIKHDNNVDQEEEEENTITVQNKEDNLDSIIPSNVENEKNVSLIDNEINVENEIIMTNPSDIDQNDDENVKIETKIEQIESQEINEEHHDEIDNDQQIEDDVDISPTTENQEINTQNISEIESVNTVSQNIE